MSGLAWGLAQDTWDGAVLYPREHSRLGLRLQHIPGAAAGSRLRLQHIPGMQWARAPSVQHSQQAAPIWRCPEPPLQPPRLSQGRQQGQGSSASPGSTGGTELRIRAHPPLPRISFTLHCFYH